MNDKEYVSSLKSMSNQELIDALAEFAPDGYVEDLWIATLKEVSKRMGAKLNLFDAWEDECPLAEATAPHGRLIDADSHKETLDDNLESMGPIIAPDGSRWFQDIDKQGWTEGK